MPVSSLPAGPAAGEPREPCPTPLSWRQVVEMFLAERERHEIAVGRHRFVAWSWGPREAPPLVLLGGMTTTPEQFALLAHLLCEEFRCVIVDDPSVDEQAGACGRSLAEFAGDVATVADHLGVDRFSLVGVGWGGAVALQTMLDHGTRIDAAVLVGGYARLRLSLVERAAFRIARWWPGPMAAIPLQRQMTEQNHRRWFPPFDHSRWEFLEAQQARVPVRVAGARAGSILHADLRSRLPEIAQSVLLVRSEGEGRMAVARTDDLAAGLPNARTENLPNTGQLSFLTHPHRLAKLVKVHLASGRR